MGLKKLHIQGAHVRKEYDFEYESFADLDKLPKTQNIINLAKCHRWKDSEIAGLPRNDCGMWRAGGLVQWAEKVCGSRHPFTGQICRVTLANDEVLWQWRTGSVLVYRLESLAEAENLYKLLFGADVDISRKEVKGLLVGSKVRFKESFGIVNPIGKMTDSLGYFTTTNWVVPKDYVARVYDVSPDGKYFMVTGVDGYDLIRVPNSGGAKMFLSVGWIRTDVVEVVEAMK